MGVDVLAPDQMVYVDFDGTYRLATDDDNYRDILEGRIAEAGDWKVFRPSSKRRGRRK